VINLFTIIIRAYYGGIRKNKKKKNDRVREKMENNQTEVKIEVNDNTFEEKVIKQSKDVLVIVDFWAEWCMPCLMLGPILEKITGEHKGKIILAKIDVDKNPKISQEYRIESIPAVKFFRNEKVVNEFIGALPESQVREYINKSLDD